MPRPQKHVYTESAILNELSIKYHVLSSQAISYSLYPVFIYQEI